MFSTKFLYWTELDLTNLIRKNWKECDILHVRHAIHSTLAKNVWNSPNNNGYSRRTMKTIFCDNSLWEYTSPFHHLHTPFFLFPWNHLFYSPRFIHGPEPSSAISENNFQTSLNPFKSNEFPMSIVLNISQKFKLKNFPKFWTEFNVLFL